MWERYLGAKESQAKHSLLAAEVKDLVLEDTSGSSVPLASSGPSLGHLIFKKLQSQIGHVWK